MFGLDDWLFLYGGGQQQFAFLTGDRQPASTDIERFFDNLAKRSTYCQMRGIPYLHLIFPSKPVVMTGKVPPPWGAKVQSLFLSRYAAALSSVLPSYIFYPLDLLLACKHQGPVYRKLDTHMTNFGSQVVAHGVLNKLGLDYDSADFFSECVANLSGDLAQMLALHSVEPALCLIPINPLLVYDNRQFLPGNTNNICIVRNPRAVTDRRLLIFGDSFIKEMLPFLSPAFRDIIYVRSETFQSDMVELCQPDFVISSNAERYLSHVESDDSSKSMFFALDAASDYHPDKLFVDAYHAQFSYRFHRNRYEYWCSEVAASYFELNGLGLCSPNGQIEVLDKDALSFRSTGIDPFFLFPKTMIEEGKSYQLEFDMVSDVSSTATVYYTKTTGGEGRFAEGQTVRVPVAIGNTRCRFALNGPYLGSKLRLDPLTCTGIFSISCISLVVVPE